MSVADSISGALRRFGRPMVLRRTSLGPGGVKIPLDVTVYGTSDGAVIQRLLGGVVQTENAVVISNAEIAAAQWPGPPINNDQLIEDTNIKTLGSAETKYLGTQILVHICKVTG